MRTKVWTEVWTTSPHLSTRTPRRTWVFYSLTTPTTRPPRMTRGEGAGSRGRGFAEGVRRGRVLTLKGGIRNVAEDSLAGPDSRKQLKAGDVLRADDGEMASVQRADGGCAESLGNGDEAAIYAAEVLIGVLNGERSDSSPVGCR